KLAAQHARRVLDDALARESMRREDVDAWIVHAGGRRVLAELQREIGISESDTSWSAAMLRDYGNLSSPFVLFVLQAALRGGAKGGWGGMSSFCARFSCPGALRRGG